MDPDVLIILVSFLDILSRLVEISRARNFILFKKFMHFIIRSTCSKTKIKTNIFQEYFQNLLRLLILIRYTYLMHQSSWAFRFLKDNQRLKITNDQHQLIEIEL